MMFFRKKPIPSPIPVQDQQFLLQKRDIRGSGSYESRTWFTQAKPAPDTLFQELDGEAVLLNIKTENYHGLDEIGTRIYQLLLEHGNPEAAVKQLLIEYTVDEDTLRKDLTNLIAQLAERGLVIVNSQT